MAIGVGAERRWWVHRGRLCGEALAPAAFELFDLAGQVLPVAGRDALLGDFPEQRLEVAQARDQRRARVVQQRDILAGTAEQVGALELLEPDAAPLPFFGESLVGRRK